MNTNEKIIRYARLAIKSEKGTISKEERIEMNNILSELKMSHTQILDTAEKMVEKRI